MGRMERWAPLTGVMVFFMGLMNVGEKAGAVNFLARILNPFMKRLFPEVPDKHPAMGQMVMNFSANMLGLDNAATPFGLKAMESLQTLNPNKDTATNAQIMFLVLNTAGITLVPSGVIAMRQAIAVEQNVAGFNAADIFLPTLIATFIAFVSGMTIVSITAFVLAGARWLTDPRPQGRDAGAFLFFVAIEHL